MKRAKQLLLDAGLGFSANTKGKTPTKGKISSKDNTKAKASTRGNSSLKTPKMFSEKSFGRDGSKFGGSLLKKSHAKSARVLDSKKPIHLVVRSTQAKGRKSFLYCGQKVESIIQRHAKSKGIRIYEMANGGNHIHIIMRIPKQRTLYAAFVRGFTGELARLMSGAKKGRKVFSTMPSPNRFWDHKPFTRILSSWGNDFVGLRNYLRINNCETILGLSRKSSRKMLAEINAFRKNSGLVATGFG